MNRMMLKQYKYSRVFIASLLGLITLISAIAFVSAGNLPATSAPVVVDKAALEKPDSNVVGPAAALAPAPISGTKSICPSGCDYVTIKAAITDIQTNGLGGPLTLELAPTYVSTGEMLSSGAAISFTNLTGSSAINTVTLRPQTGATNLIITGNNASAIIDLNNQDFVTIDGRPGGSGSGKELTIENTNTSAPTVRLFGGADDNTIKYTSLKGATTSTTAGVVTLATFSAGGDNNTIDHCDIQGSGEATPRNGVYAGGSSFNSGNTVSNCHIFDFYAASDDASGIRIERGTAWTITGNSFYQRVPRTGTNSTVRAIYVNVSFGGNNFIGGSDIHATGTPWTITGTMQPYRFIGIQLFVDSFTPSSVQGNVVQNFVWTSSMPTNTEPGVWTGLYVQGGSANVGTTTGNIIGNDTGTGSVSVTTSGSQSITYGIVSSAHNTVVISNNAIGSITVNGSTNTVSASITGVALTSGTVTVSNNTIGSKTTLNSLNASTSGDAGGQHVTGIASTSTFSTAITGNTVANLRQRSRR